MVAGLLLGGPLYLEMIVPERLRSTGQGLLATIGVGLGAVASHLAAGWLLQHAGPRAPYLVGGIGSLLLAALIPMAAAAGREGGARRGRGGRCFLAADREREHLAGGNAQRAPAEPAEPGREPGAGAGGAGG